MKKVFSIIFIMVFVLSIIGLGIFNKIGKEFKTNNAAQSLNLSFNSSSPSQNTTKDFTLNLSGQDLQNNLNSGLLPNIAKPNIKINDEKILLSYTGKAYFTYTGEANVIPKADGGNLKLEVTNFKAFGIPANFLKGSFEEMINKSISSKINEGATINNVSINNNKIIITGVKK
ncbi:hypothetical protein AUK11_04430 [bacterium CG2_30_37_16]|nr:MAG: hypothetical protein AUK11_04430 [bacterium CG2_30_37_16]PIP31145.1 MAG: hypothetical protein COX25_00935 [bacterium (Candidatus Howlettbacteria) CG23_combo_of_CG06-09_8_20_14_all_37_9]PIX99795.1 MAG: hypothetical protein COZ22_01665 [bacterium (Candidatus Howlettbacteria) CG_4_10_14_3_um_filter_37_10]PJB05153.1 MAG: hypothetical protein CO123_04585 [bacterium (Candidatus Howlettbacteria) CG_4_9_14_3_um_filter_37_10]